MQSFKTPPPTVKAVLGGWGRGRVPDPTKLAFAMTFGGNRFWRSAPGFEFAQAGGRFLDLGLTRLEKHWYG